MSVTDLTKEQLTELKENYLCETQENVSYNELANVNDIISDKLIKSIYAGVSFVPDDFFCTAFKEDKAQCIF